METTKQEPTTQTQSSKGGVMRWVSVSERLPEKHNQFDYYSDWVLAVDSSGYIFRSRYDYKYNLWVNRANVPDDPVTHWMPLPLPPIS